MWRLLDIGYMLLDSVQDIGSWLTDPIDNTVIRAFNLISWIEIPYGITVADLLFGVGLVLILSYKVIKFLLPS